MCLVWLPLPQLLSLTVPCHPELASPLQISSTDCHPLPRALERAHIGCKRAASPLRQCYFLKQPKYVTHCSFFLQPPATTQSCLQQLGCFPGRLAHKAFNCPTTTPQTGPKVINGAFIIPVIYTHKLMDCGSGVNQVLVCVIKSS